MNDENPLHLLRTAALFLLAGAIGLMALLTSGCGDDVDEYTWGDAALEVGNAYCDLQAQCGYSGDHDVCADHVRWHLCEPDQSCGVPVDAEAEVDACVAALDAWSSNPQEFCVAAYYGFAPPECDPLWDLDPGPQETDQ